LWPIAKQREFLAFIGGENMSNHLEEISDEVLLDVSFLNEIEELLEDKKQVIFYGPPGAGKTYIAMKLAEALSEGSEELNPVELVQFHPSYAYEDFVEGFRPSEEGSFKLRRGKLLSIADRAIENPDTKFFLIIDEINRGNVAKIFGEMYFLLEYRDKAIQLQYSDEPFKMPKNLYFIGTMNSADRSIGLIDSALRRRFHFVSFYPTEEEMKDLLRNWLKQNAPDVVWIADAVDEINSKIDRNFAIGPSHFMKSNLDDALARKIWKRSILPYIEDVFFNQQSKVDEFKLENLRTLKRLYQDKLAAENELEEDDSAAEAS
jgi:5-methylcytosine-specific restriction endonuclease McrBC GTP-binding regulatory subunit McrB